MNPHHITRDFEAALCAYTGAPFAVAVNSCTMALLLAVAWHFRANPWRVADDPKFNVEIPKHTYCSVPMSIIHAGGRPVFRDEDWLGYYQLKPLPVWDCARFLSSGMYRSGGDYMEHGMLCVSFHASKTLGDTQGGAILHDSTEADAWFRRARFDGRTEGIAPKDDTFTQIGWHCYMNPDTAARLLWKLSVLPKHNAPLPNDPYPDLSLCEAFK